MLLWYSPHEIYRLVTDIERYPEFLPWCERVEILERDAHTVTARLHLAYSGLRHAFTTRNRHVPDEAVRIGLVDGPFSQLDGDWRFLPLPIPSADPASKIEFEMRYAFSNPILEAAISPVFDRIANTFVDSFVQRAESLYGAR